MKPRTRFFVSLSVALAGISAPARAQPPVAPEPTPAAVAPAPTPLVPAAGVAPAAPDKPAAVSVHGYVQPQLGWRSRPTALAADRAEYGLLASRTGLIVSGEPVRSWSYTLHLSLDARGISVLTGADLADVNGDGAAENLSTTRRDLLGVFFEEASVQFRPIEEFAVKVGVFRLPFSLALRRSNIGLMFPERAGASELFVSGADRGGIVHGHFLSDRIEVSAGVFNGSSLSLLVDDAQARGLLFSGRVDAAPLGRLPSSEYDFGRGRFRFALGAGALYRRATLYTLSAYELFEQDDTRTSASLRVAFAGLYLQAEVLRRLATDAISSRPSRSTGGYGQASYYVPLPAGLGIAPIARLTGSTVEEFTKPYSIVSYDLGAAFFPRADGERPEAVRVIAQYTSERRSPEGEAARAISGQVQILF